MSVTSKPTGVSDDTFIELAKRHIANNLESIRRVVGDRLLVIVRDEQAGEGAFTPSFVPRESALLADEWPEAEAELLSSPPPPGAFIAIVVVPSGSQMFMCGIQRTTALPSVGDA